MKSIVWRVILEGGADNRVDSQDHYRLGRVTQTVLHVGVRVNSFDTAKVPF